MTTFVLLSKLSPAAIDTTSRLSEVDDIFSKELAVELPEVKRIASYVLLGPYDFVHIIEAPDELAAAKVALMVNRFGSAATQTLTAIPIDQFKQVASQVNEILVATN